MMANASMCALPFLKKPEAETLNNNVTEEVAHDGVGKAPAPENPTGQHSTGAIKKEYRATSQGTEAGQCRALPA